MCVGAWDTIQTATVSNISAAILQRPDSGYLWRRANSYTLDEDLIEGDHKNLIYYLFRCRMYPVA